MYVLERERSFLHPFPLLKTIVLIDLALSLGSREEKKAKCLVAFCRLVPGKQVE